MVLEVANARLDWLLRVLYLFLKNRGSITIFCQTLRNEADQSVPAREEFPLSRPDARELTVKSQKQRHET